MTSLALVLWIAAAILLQIAVYLGSGFWNHWLEYRALRHRAGPLLFAVGCATAGLLPHLRQARTGTTGQ